MKLSCLLKNDAGRDIMSFNPIDSIDPDITSIHYDSRTVEPGGLFVAICGVEQDGNDYIPDALKNGAVAIITEKPINVAAPVIVAENSRHALSLVAAKFYGNPTSRLKVIGITGTNGKSTTAYLIESILQKAGYNPGVIGTIDYHYNGKNFSNPVTTPESLDLMRIFSEMEKHHVTHIVMEVSSHALDQSRVAHCYFDVGIFTNLSQDHLDYHASLDRYFECKKKLFTQIMIEGPKRTDCTAILNCMHPYGKKLASEVSLPSLTIGTEMNDHLVPINPIFRTTGITAKIRTPEGIFEVNSPLAGHHNLENILCATGAALALGIPLNTIKNGIEAVHFVPGRLEAVRSNQSKAIFVDYAHTPDALENVLKSLRTITQGRLICVFGCGGDRDRGKRALMGEISARLADLTIITSDNPRTESPEKIIQMILDGVKRVMPDGYPLQNNTHASSYFVVADRKQAIAQAIEIARSGDTVLIAGKGHEDYQIIGRTKYPFDDRQIAREVLERLYNSDHMGSDTYQKRNCTCTGN